MTGRRRGSWCEWHLNKWRNKQPKSLFPLDILRRISWSEKAASFLAGDSWQTTAADSFRRFEESLAAWKQIKTQECLRTLSQHCLLFYCLLQSPVHHRRECNLPQTLRLSCSQTAEDTWGLSCQSAVHIKGLVSPLCGFLCCLTESSLWNRRKYLQSNPQHSLLCSTLRLLQWASCRFFRKTFKQRRLQNFFNAMLTLNRIVLCLLWSQQARPRGPHIV